MRPWIGITGVDYVPPEGTGLLVEETVSVHYHNIGPLPARSLTIELHARPVVPPGALGAHTNANAFLDFDSMQFGVLFPGEDSVQHFRLRGSQSGGEIRTFDASDQLTRNALGIVVSATSRRLPRGTCPRRGQAMDFNAGAAIGGGLVATAVMTAMLYMGIALMPQRMTMNLLYMLGTMMTRGTTAAYLVGAMMHGSMGVVFALSHVGAYQVFGLQSDLLGWGVFFGFLHWIAFGVGLGMVGTVHPLMRTGQMAAPGAFALNYPAATVAGALMVHLVYGALVGVLYEAWV